MGSCRKHSHSIMKKRKKSVLKSKTDALDIVDGPRANGTRAGSAGIQKSPESTKIAEAAEQRVARWMSETFGTEDRALQDQLLCQATSAVSDFAGKEMATFDHVAAALRGIRPQDALEGMLATQMVAVHTLAMTCMQRAAWNDQSDLGIEVNLNRATKLLRTFAIQTEALNRYRGRGEQKMFVEHVHVHKGAQAVVGSVSQSGFGKNTKNRSSSDESE